MKAIVLTDKGLGVIEAPDKPEYFDHIDGQIPYIAILEEYEQALEAAMKQVVLFRGQKGIKDILLLRGIIPEKGKHYPVPEGYEIKIETTCIYDGNRVSCANETCWDLNECQRSPAKDYAILVPKQEPVKVGNDGFMFDLNSTYPKQPSSIEETAEAYADSQERRGTSVWQGMYRGYQAGVKSDAAKEYWFEIFKQENK